MPNFSGSLPLLDLSEVRYTATLNKIMGQILRESARVWLRSMLSQVPEETSMAKAALTPVAEYLENVASASLNPTRNPYYSKTEDGIQSPQLGFAKTFFRITDDSTNGTTLVFSFEWDTATIHYWREGFYQGPAPSGPELLERANAEFERHAQQAINKRLPRVRDFIRAEAVNG